MNTESLSNLQNSLSGLISIAFLGGIISRVSSYGLTLIIARALDPEAVGAFAFGFVVLNISSLFARTGLGGTVKKLIPIYQNEQKESYITGVALTSLLVPFLLGSAISVLLYIGYLYRNSLFGNFGPTTKIFLLGIPLLSVLRVGVSTSLGFQETRYAVLVRDLVRPIFAIGAVLVFAYVFRSIDLVIVGYLLSLLVGCFCIVYALRHQGAFNRLRSPEFELKRTFLLAFPLLFSSIGQYFTQWTDILMLGFLAAPAEVGKYQVAYRTSTILLFVLAAASSLIPSVISSLYHSDRKERLREVFVIATKWITYLTVFGYVFLLIYSSEFLQLFGKSFVGAQRALIILATVQLLAASSGPIGFMLTMSGHERYEVMNATISSILNVVLNYVLILQFGIVGAAVATGISITVMNGLRIAQVWRFLGVMPRPWKCYRAIPGLILASLLMIGLKRLPLSPAKQIFVVGGLTGVLFLLYLKWYTFTDEDRILLSTLDQ